MSGISNGRIRLECCHDSDGSAVAANREDRTTAASDENFDTERDFVIAGQAVGGMHDVRPNPTKSHDRS